MTKITLELIESSIQRTNPLKDRELVLKGNKLSLIENLGTTLDQFDALDFTDNEIHRFENFPYLKRLKSINFTNNKVMKIERDLNQFIPNITTLIFINNNIQELSQIDNLQGFKQLEFVSFLKNPVANQHNYRSYVIHRLPQVRILDFSRVKLKERQLAASIFGPTLTTPTNNNVSEESAILRANGHHSQLRHGKSTTVSMETELAKQSIEGMDEDPSEMMDDEFDQTRQMARMKPTVADMQALKAAIQNASTIEEVDQLNFLLNTGKFAGFADGQGGQFHRHHHPLPQQHQMNRHHFRN